ncbi:MAG TPA: nucleoside deaminase [Alphaproteobacteria bacterium]|nr:nucleoside deaminase [Alphaproteobacteria bacterium]
MASDHEHFMAMAIAEAKAGAASGEQPFGAVVVRHGQVVCRSRSLKVSTSDATAHSETLAIKYATQKLGERHIPDAVFYATCEPCPMCLGAILNAGIKTLVLGARNADIQNLAKLAFNFHKYTAESFAEFVGWDLTVVTGVLHEDCVALYRDAAVELTR